MDRILAMSTLIAAVDEGSLSAASRALGVPLSTVSRRVADLEAHLGTGLISRTSRRVELTAAGRDYIVSCRRILADLEDAELTASGEYKAPRGELTITAPIVFGRLHLLPVVTAFLGAYPDIDVRLTLADRVFDLVDEHVDVALRIGDLPDSSLRAVRVGDVRPVTCASPDYIDQHGAPKTPDDLRQHDCITFGGFGSTPAWTFVSGKSSTQAPVRSRLAVNTAEAAIDAAIASVGITRVLSYQVAAAVRSGKLAVVLKAFEPAASPVNLVHPGQLLLPLKTRAFLDFAAPRLKKALRRG
jgi:DNA-binding transcriptional LysR family regulator